MIVAALRRGVDATAFCKASECRQFIEWAVDYGTCSSCKLVGQSYVVDTIPANCEKMHDVLHWLDSEGVGNAE